MSTMTPNTDALSVDVDATPREMQAIELINQRLLQRFPSVPADEVRHTVDLRYHQLDGSRIRDFVPIFVERNAREDLAQLRVS